MDYRKSDAPVNTQTRNILDFCKGTDNIRKIKLLAFFISAD